MDQADESKVDIRKLVSLYLIAHKYQFKSHEKFAQGLLRAHCSNIEEKPPHIQEYFVSCSQRRLKALMKIALLTEEATTNLSLRSSLQKIWLFCFEQKPHESMFYALDIGEMLELRSFMGKLYYYLLITIDAHRNEGSMVYSHPVDDSTPHQRLLFFQGYWSLQQYWSNFIKASQKKFRCPSNQPTHGCNQVWKEFWPKFKLEIAGHRFAPVEHLKFGISLATLVNKESFYKTNISCIESYIKEMVKELEDNLADHFLDPLPSVPPSVEVE